MCLMTRLLRSAQPAREPERRACALRSFASPMTRHLKRRLLERALEIAGSRAALAELLDVERHALDLWLAGRATLPDRVFVTATDMVLDDDIARAAQDRRRGPREPQPVDASV